MQDSKLQDTSRNYGGLEFEVKGWQFLKLTDKDGNFITGRYKMKLYEPPLRRPPIDLTKVKEKDVVIDFAMHEFRYDDKDLENFKKEMRKKKVAPNKNKLNDVSKDV